MAVSTRPIDITHQRDALEGMLAFDDSKSGKRPAVLIAHTWAGRSEFEVGYARKIADLGYAGFALDLFGKGVFGTSKEENQALIQPFLDDRAKLQDRLIATIDAVKNQPEVDGSKIVVMGFCFGGLCALDVARTGTNIAGCASFHGLFYTPGNTDGTKIKAKVIVFHGYDDPMATPDQMVGLTDELTKAEADWQLHALGSTMHAFTNKDANDPGFGTVYSADATRRSWAVFKNFLEECFA